MLLMMMLLRVPITIVLLLPASRLRVVRRRVVKVWSVVSSGGRILFERTRIVHDELTYKIRLRDDDVVTMTTFELL